MDDTPPAQERNEPEIERIVRADGRYVLYFSWPDDAADDRGTPTHEPEADDE